MAPLEFTPAALVGVSLPLVVLSAGLGTVQGLGCVVSQGYRVPVNRVTVVLGLTSLVDALFGGHPSITSRSGIPIVAGPEAGPASGRYWASVIAGVLSLLIALAGLAMLSSF